LRWPWIEIKIFGFPTHDGGIHHGHIQQSQIPCPAHFTKVLFNKVFGSNGIPMTRRCIGGHSIGPEMNDAIIFPAIILGKVVNLRGFILHFCTAGIWRRWWS
jgi:hypothetical protein